MIGKRGVAVAVLVGSVLGAAACGPKRDATMGPTVTSGPDASGTQSAEARIAQLGTVIDQFAASRAALSGHGDEQSRRNQAESFWKMRDMLALLEGPQPAGAFRQQMRIIERAAAQLTSGSTTAPEPTVNAALRAAQNALSGMASDQFADDEEVGKRLAALRPRIAELDTVRGPLHGLVTAQALDEVGKVAQRMADTLKQRLPQDQPATAPATAPAAATNPV